MEGAALVGQHQPGGVDRQQVHALVGEPVEQLDDVVVVDEGVGKGHQYLGKLARSAGVPAHGVDTPLGVRRSWCSSCEPESARHDVAGDLIDGAFVGEGVGPEHGQGLLGGDVGLGEDHAGRLVDLRPMQG